MPPSNKSGIYLRYFFLVFFIFLLLPHFFNKQPETGLDNSWIIAMNLAWKYNLQFGKDFVFTYGPLGILESRLPISINLFVYLFFDIYLLFNVFIILKQVFKKYFNYGVVLFIFLSIMLAQGAEPYQWYFIFFLFFLFSFIKSPDRKIYLVHAALLSLISFYFKVSLGICSLFLFILAVTYVLIRGKRSLKWYATVLFSYLLALLSSAYFLHVSLIGYIKGSLMLIDNYNDIMSRILEDRFRIYLAAAVFIIFIIAFWIISFLVTAIRKKEVIKDMDRIFVCCLTCFSLFILFKSSFVRSNMELFLFFQLISLYVAFLYLYCPSGFKRKVIACCCWISLVVSVCVMNTVPAEFRPYIRGADLSLIPAKIKEVENYISQIKNFNARSAALDSLDTRDNAYKAILGNHTVDIIPTEISRIFFNGLNYHPRPVIQSYAAYDEYLDNLNYRKYMGPDAPDYILFSLGSIDYRYPFFDESKTKMAILSRYKIVNEINGDLVLRKKEIAEDLKVLAGEDTLNIKLGEDVWIKESRNLQYSRILIDYNLWGRIKRFFYQPPLLKMTLTLENNDSVTFRVASPMLADGVILNKYIQTEKEFQLLMQSDGRFNTNVEKIRLEPDSSGMGFAPEIKMLNTYYAFPDKTASERRADSMATVKLMKEYDDYRPVSIDPAFYKEEEFRYGISNLMSYSPIVTFEGWAFRDKGDNTNSEVKAVLKSRFNMYELPSMKHARPDLAELFHRKDVAGAGFKATVSKAQLPPGDYQIGIIILDTVSKKRWIRYTDSRLQIKSNYRIEKTDSFPSGSVGQKDIEYVIEPVQEYADKILVKGWAFVKNEVPQPMTTNLILQAKGATYRVNTDIIRRMDVADHFKDSLLLYSGFYVEIPRKQLPAGIYKMGIEKVYPDGKTRSMVFTDHKIKSGISDDFVPVPVSELPPLQDFNLGIDFVKDGQGTVTVSGWAIQKMEDVDKRTVEIVLKSDKGIYVSGTELRKRPDVTAWFKNKFNLDNCGFFASISKKQLPPGTYEVGIKISRNGNAGAVKFIGRSIVKQ